MALLLCFLFLISASSAAAACDRCVHQSKAAYFSQSSALSSQLGLVVMGQWQLDSTMAVLHPSSLPFTKNGSACGACFQIRCKNETVCSSNGTRVIVTDQNFDNKTDFVLSSRSFKGMAKHGSELQLSKLGIVDVEYKRVPCHYKKGQNLAVRVEESSQNPHYLAVKVLYQGGQTEIVSMDIAAVGSSTWSSMSRNHGAVWDTNRVPAGALQFRFTVTAGKPIWAHHVLPADWKAGVVYDAGVQTHDIAQEACTPCDASNW